MPKLALFNMAFGFLVMFFAACTGAFVSFDLTQAYLHDLSQLNSWQIALLKSAHGHCSLFGLTQIAFGLTLPYSPLSLIWKKMQSLGFFAGLISMGPGMMLRAFAGPSDSFNGLGICIGLGLTAILVSLGSHAAALFLKCLRRDFL